MRSLLLVVAATAGVLAPAPAPGSVLRFDVVSIKRNLAGDPNASVRPAPGGGMLAKNMTLRSLVRNTYMVPDHLLVGGPSWLDADRFDIVATGNGQDAPFDLLLERAKALLSERGLSLFTAVQEQLGLKLEPQRSPVEVLVIDRAEQPTEN